MNTCKTCKWWLKPVPYLAGMISIEERISDFGNCGNPKLDIDCRTRLVTENPIVQLDGAFADASSDRAQFTTGPDFGCIHHSEGQSEIGVLAHQPNPPNLDQNRINPPSKMNKLFGKLACKIFGHKKLVMCDRPAFTDWVSCMKCTRCGAIRGLAPKF